MHNRRQFLAAAAATGVLSVAGCSEDSGDDEEDDEDDGTEGQSPGSRNTEAPGDVSLDLDIRPANISGFDELVVRFEAFELRSESETVRRDGSGEEIDLAAVDSADLTETNVPAGTYTDAACFIPVVDFTRSDGSGSGQTITEDDPLLIELDSFDSFELESGMSTTFEVLVNVQQNYQGDGWKFLGGYSSYSQ